MNELISIIVPVYNVMNVLHFCVESILNQTYANFELILVDDGSTDKSGELCDQYKEKDKRISVIHKENGGVSSARNIGVENAKGEYICFVDSDDYVEKEFLSEMIGKAEEGFDFVVTGFNWVNDYNHSSIKTVIYKNDEGYAIVDKNSLMDLSTLFLLSQPWNKLYKKSIISDNEIKTPEDISLGEDTVFVYRYLSAIIKKKYSVINLSLYNYYFNNSNSLLNKYRSDLFEISAKLNRYLYKEVEKWNLSEEQMKQFYNGCYYRMENVLHNTFRKESSLSIKERIAYNSNIIRSNEFQYWQNKSTCRINLVFKFAYLIKSYYPIYLFKRIKGESVDK